MWTPVKVVILPEREVTYTQLGGGGGGEERGLLVLNILYLVPSPRYGPRKTCNGIN